MIVTIPYIKEKFLYWNREAFNNELPLPTFELMTSKRTLGQYSRRRVLGETIHKIRISDYYDSSEKRIIETIVHEMIHYYIRYKGIKDTSSHGPIWKKMAYELSQKFDLNITRLSNPMGEISEATKEKKSKNGKKYEYVILVKTTADKYGAAVVPPQKLSFFIKNFKYWNMVQQINCVYAPWTETYTLRHLKTRTGYRLINHSTYLDLMANKQIEI